MRVNPKIQFALLGLLLAGAAAAQPAPPVPEGYTAVPFVSEQPEQSFTAAEQVLELGKDYGAVIETSKGTITIDLAEKTAPKTVNNFVFLSLHRFYQGIVFHRVLDGFMAQTGDPTGTGTGDPGYLFADEFAEGVYFDKPGVVAMANAGPGTSTNGSQFFITFLATPHLDGLHTIFGEVTAGMGVLERLQRIDPSRPDTILEPWRLLTYVRQQGIELQGDPQQRLEDYLTETLGKFPEVGERFEIDGASAVIGQGQDEPLVGFFPKPDIIESVTIIERDAQQ